MGVYDHHGLPGLFQDAQGLSIGWGLSFLCITICDPCGQVESGAVWDAQVGAEGGGMSGISIEVLSKEALASRLDSFFFGLGQGHGYGDPGVVDRMIREMLGGDVADAAVNLVWASESHRAAWKRLDVPCRGCAKRFALSQLYRCFHCGSYFCYGCARVHFGDRPGRKVVA